MTAIRTLGRGHARAGAVLSVLLAAFDGASALADGQADLRAALARLDSRAPIRAALDVSTFERYGTGRGAVERAGRVGLSVEESSRGLQIIYGTDTLAGLEAEALARSRDPEARTPTKDAVAHLEASSVERMLSAASGLAHQLEEARFTGERAATWHGQPARVVSFALPVTSLDEAQRKYVKTFEGTLDVWIAQDGTPLASSSRAHLQGRAFIFVGFERHDDDDTLYAVHGDRLTAAFIDSHQVGTGGGERAELRVVKTLAPE